MSMLSKQCKELRAEAERIGYWSPTASRLMFDAADILWSLRNKNVALLGENESLQAENDRLRELVEDMLDCIEIRAAFNRPPTTEMHEQFAKRASELGVEVEP